MKNWTLEIGQVRLVREGYKHRSGQKMIIEYFMEVPAKMQPVYTQPDGWQAFIGPVIGIKVVGVVWDDGIREILDPLWVRGCSEVL